MKQLSISISVDEDTSPAYWVDFAIVLTKVVYGLLRSPEHLIDSSQELRGTDDTPCGTVTVSSFGDGQDVVEYVEPVNDVPF